MKYTHLLLFALLCGALSTAQARQNNTETDAINTLMDAWHQAAATADADGFFGKMTAECIYIGTDKTERWKRDELREWSAKYFDRDTAWAFSPIERQVYLDPKGKVAWFNETLQTRFGVCRSSGVLLKVKKEGWKLQHYHLSLTLDNDLMPAFIELINGKTEVPPPAEAQEAVLVPIKQLFNAMRQGDGALLLDAFVDEASLHSAVMSKEGKPMLRPGDLAHFAETVAAPHEQVYDERILSYQVRIDGPMATVWTPYLFYVGEQFSHCGVNAFQVVNTERGWKILNITDTRKKAGCKEE